MKVTTLSLPGLTLEELRNVAAPILIRVAIASSAYNNGAPFRKKPPVMEAKNTIIEWARDYAKGEGRVYETELLFRAVDDLIEEAEAIRIDSIKDIIALYPNAYLPPAPTPHGMMLQQ